MGRYVFYEEFQGILVNVWRKSVGLSKRQFKREGHTRESVMRELATVPGFYQSLESVIAIEESDYEAHNRPVVLPQDDVVLNMLWRSRVEVNVEDLTAFPRVFTMAWPRNSVIDDVKLTPCLIWFGPSIQRRDMLRNASWVDPAVRMDDHSGDRPQYCFHMTYGGGHGERFQCYRASIPDERLRACLSSPEAMNDEVGTYGALFTNELNEDERHKQYVHLKLVLFLLVYAAACPDAVYEEWPEHMGPSPSLTHYKPTILGSPAIPDCAGTHGSPKPHWRNAYFRSYPRRRDGTRRIGMLPVKGGPVNAPMKPHTVKKVKS